MVDLRRGARIRHGGEKKPTWIEATIVHSTILNEKSDVEHIVNND
jgi:hypothetical protein